MAVPTEDRERIQPEYKACGPPCIALYIGYEYVMFMSGGPFDPILRTSNLCDACSTLVVDSSHPNPVTFFAKKRAKGAKWCGELIDIHDVGAVDPRDYDVFFTDMDDTKLRAEVAEVTAISEEDDLTSTIGFTLFRYQPSWV